MKPNILNDIEEQQEEIAIFQIIKDIEDRCINKFSPFKGIINLNDLVDYIITQITWKKQSQFTWLVALVKSCTEQLELDFYSLDEDKFKTCECYRDVYSIIKTW